MLCAFCKAWVHFRRPPRKSQNFRTAAACCRFCDANGFTQTVILRAASERLEGSQPNVFGNFVLNVKVNVAEATKRFLIAGR
jgi:hypothetical protein